MTLPAPQNHSLAPGPVPAGARPPSRQIACRLHVILHAGNQFLQVKTESVSRQGMFVRPGTLPAFSRPLVQIEVELPPDGATFKCQALCVYDGEDALRVCGRGLEPWDAFIDRLKASPG